LFFQNTFYKLDASGYHGNGGDAFTDSHHPNNGMAFTTYDQDHDKSSSNCADIIGGGWWYVMCGYGNINGFNYRHAKSTHMSMSWRKFGDAWESLKTISMAIRPIGL
jgi:ficolin